MIRPVRLKPGDTIATLSPSWGGPFAYPHIYEEGVRVLQEVFGFRIKEYPTVRMSPSDLSAKPRTRAQDINAAFQDEEVVAIVCTIGGDDSVRILEYLDIDGILKNPKAIFGYSDCTTVLSYLNTRGLVTYYGSSVMAGFSHITTFPEAIREYKQVLFEGNPYPLLPFSEWADGYAKWREPANRGKTLPVRTDDVGHRWINGSRRSAGRLWGGCIEILAMMLGTAFWPEPAFLRNAVLFLETSEEKPTPKQVSYFLRNLGVQGILEGLEGLLIARPRSYSAEEKSELDAVILRIVVGEFGRKDLNIVTNLDFGHTEPRHILPLGNILEMDPVRGTLVVTEPPFRSGA